MLRFIFILSLTCFYSCNNSNKKNRDILPNSSKQVSPSPLNDEIILKMNFHSFDTSIDVLFWDTKDSISEIQRQNYTGFISKQDLLTPEILKKIFEFYKSVYSDYKKGWSSLGNISDKELEKNLPKPTTPEALKKFISPGIIYIQNKKDCKLGTLGIEFDCTWDIENGVGVKIENWKVVETGVAETSYFLSANNP